MKKNYLFLGLVGLSLLTAGCSDRSQFPSSPRNGERYQDRDGNVCVWNAAMNYWVITSMMNGQRVNNYYYPSTRTYSRSTTVVHHTTVHENHTTYSNHTTNSRAPRSSGGFGSTGRGVSVGS